MGSANSGSRDPGCLAGTGHSPTCLQGAGGASEGMLGAPRGSPRLWCILLDFQRQGFTCSFHKGQAFLLCCQGNVSASSQLLATAGSLCRSLGRSPVGCPLLLRPPAGQAHGGQGAPPLPCLLLWDGSCGLYDTQRPHQQVLWVLAPCPVPLSPLPLGLAPVAGSDRQSCPWLWVFCQSQVPEKLEAVGGLAERHGKHLDPSCVCAHTCVMTHFTASARGKRVSRSLCIRADDRGERQSPPS